MFEASDTKNKLELKVMRNPVLGASLRILDISGEPWFVARDVCDALGIEQTGRALEKLDDDEKGVNPIHTLGGTQKMWIVSESGLYALILRSDKPAAKSFRKWITSEVLPQIRRTGGYSPLRSQLAALEAARNEKLGELARLEDELSGLRMEAAREIALEMGVAEELGKLIAVHDVQALPAPAPAPVKERRVRTVRSLNYKAEAEALPLPAHVAVLTLALMERGLSRANASQRICRMKKQGFITRNDLGIYEKTTS